MPIQENCELLSSADSTASIAFEGDSTAIVGPLSRVMFHQLALDPNGDRLTGVTIEHGLASFHVLPQHHPRSGKKQSDEALSIHVGDVKVTATSKCRFRVDIKQGYLRVEIFNGELRFAISFNAVELYSGRSIEHKIGGEETAFDIHRGIEKNPWDGFSLLEEQKVQSEPKGKKNRGPEDVNALIRFRRMSRSTDDGLKDPRPPHPPY